MRTRTHTYAVPTYVKTIHVPHTHTHTHYGGAGAINNSLMIPPHFPSCLTQVETPCCRMSEPLRLPGTGVKDTVPPTTFGHEGFEAEVGKTKRKEGTKGKHH